MTALASHAEGEDIRMASGHSANPIQLATAIGVTAVAVLYGLVRLLG